MLRLVTLALAAALPPVSLAQPPKADPAKAATVRAEYTKFEYRVFMRDGVTLFTAVYVPKDDAKTYPILLMRTPYSCSPYGPDSYPEKLGPSPLFQKAGYIF